MDNQKWYIWIMEYLFSNKIYTLWIHETMWMNIRIFLLGKGSQAQKSVYSMILSVKTLEFLQWQKAYQWLYKIKVEGNNYCLGDKETLEVMEIFGILIVVLVSPMCIFIKIHQTVQLKLHFMIKMSCFKLTSIKLFF